MGYVTKEEVECKSCGRIIRKNELQYDSPEGRICSNCYGRKQPRLFAPSKETPRVRSGEKVLGIIRVSRSGFMGIINEDLFLTPDRVIVARRSGGFGGMLFGGAIGAGIEAAITARKGKKKEKEYLELPIEDILKADKHNFAIPNSEVTKIELKSRRRFHITTSKYALHKWYAGLILPEEKGKKVRYPEDYEDILRPIFGDKLSVKK